MDMPSDFSLEFTDMLRHLRTAARSLCLGDAQAADDLTERVLLQALREVEGNPGRVHLTEQRLLEILQRLGYH